MFTALIVSNIVETPRWITEHVSFKSQRHAQPFLDGTELDDLPEGNILQATPIFPPDGQTLDPFSASVTVPFTSQSEAQAVAVAEAVRANPPAELKRHAVDRSTPIYVVDPKTRCPRAAGL
ncbi:MAG TPA: hypothetical protein VIK18_22370 [Pirellulales bacterium]